ncbi:MAG TPA: tetratricopeptide repeat protein [Bacteroidales bacterium]|nr:tetratricopeptide repeat protein [Bacteroidales bacterium]HPS73950.1 tetratricopeptide repeat protein [Bacteroidales bacterium]
MRKGIRLLLMVFLSAGFLPVLHGQDRSTGTPPALPFRQNAPTESNEQLALQFFQSRDYEKAAELYEKLYEKRPGPFYYTYYLYSLIETKDFDRAEKLVREQRRQDPDAMRYLVDLGYVTYRGGDTEKARKMYEEAVRKMPAQQQQINELANAFIMRGENDYAIRVYRKGRELLNGSYPFSLELASIFERTGDIKNTIEEYLELISVNESYLKTVEDKLQNLLANDPDNTRNEEVRKALLTRVQKNPDREVYSELMWWYSIQQKDFGMALIQAKSLDRRLKENGQRLVSLAQVAVSNEQYEVAEEAYRYILAKGKNDPYFDLARTELLNTRYLRYVNGPLPLSEELVKLEKEFLDELAVSGYNYATITLILDLAHLDAFYLNKPDEATLIMNKTLEMPDLKPEMKARCKTELADILLFYGDVWEATLLYQQVYKDFKYDVIGQTAKFKNAKLSFYIGEFKWAKAQADVLKAATSKLISNDAMALSLLIGENFDADSGTVALNLYARADLLDYKNQSQEALATLDSILLLFDEHPIMDEMFFRKALILLKTGKAQEADSLLGLVVSIFPDGFLADSALMKRAEIRERWLNDKEGAMKYYREIFEKYPGGVYAVDARQRYRILRGDIVH